MSVLPCHFIPLSPLQCPMNTGCVGIQQVSMVGQGKHVMEATDFNGLLIECTHIKK